MTQDKLCLHALPSALTFLFHLLSAHRKTTTKIQTSQLLNECHSRAEIHCVISYTSCGCCTGFRVLDLLLDQMTLQSFPDVKTVTQTQLLTSNQSYSSKSQQNSLFWNKCWFSEGEIGKWNPWFMRSSIIIVTRQMYF